MGQGLGRAGTIANCVTAKAFGVELRTQERYAAGVEVSLTNAQRRNVKERFADSPVKLVGLACSERYDWLDSAKLQEAIATTRAHLKLGHDVGGDGLRVFGTTGIKRRRTRRRSSRSRAR